MSTRIEEFVARAPTTDRPLEVSFAVRSIGAPMPPRAWLHAYAAGMSLCDGYTLEEFERFHAAATDALNILRQLHAEHLAPVAA
jgi:hypothetical protein